jgi:hypothetical protein
MAGLQTRVGSFDAAAAAADVMMYTLLQICRWFKDICDDHRATVAHAGSAQRGLSPLGLVCYCLLSIMLANHTLLLGAAVVVTT